MKHAYITPLFRNLPSTYIFDIKQRSIFCQVISIAIVNSHQSSALDVGRTS